MHRQNLQRTSRDIEIDECKLLFLAWISAISGRVSEAQDKHNQDKYELNEILAERLHFYRRYLQMAPWVCVE